MIEGLMRPAKILGRLAPERIVIAGYLFYIVTGTLLLMLPFAQKSGATASFTDHVFVASSAVSTTGLSTVSVYSTYSFWGQLIILGMIQLGGLGYMTAGSFISMAISGKMSPFQRDISSSVLSLPAGFEIAKFIKSVISFTLIIELIGAISLYPIFASHHAPNPLWQAIFHSISAFCTAGFSLFDNSFEDYRSDIALNLIIMILSYSGAIGFIVLSDWYEWLRGKRKSMTLTSKIIIWSTFWISAVASILMIFDEALLNGKPLWDKYVSSIFQVMSASTTVGFNSIPIGSLSTSTLLLLILVMMIGASPSGTGGGIKTTAVSALWALMCSVICRRKEVQFSGKVIPEARIRTATASLIFYLFVLFAGIYLISLTDKSGIMELAFECASAIGTVGLSCGITSSLSEGGKWIIIALMFLGRVGPLSLAAAFFLRKTSKKADKTEDIAV